ncbi:LytTR family DNA-binding domain-containing protein [Emticicia sp. W12TSBA100-4]|uniref:LytR/AlgR family response regulator transcription factor n=1 Tax=Emticicia sp. W12TSBA100-4 TaxID=3160965 RepID=UPI003305898C
MKTNTINPKTCNSEILYLNHRKKSVHTEDVVYLKSYDNYTRFYLNDGQVILASYTMKIFEKQLSGKGDFTRIHRGTLVNLKYLTGIERTKDGHVACLSTGQRIDVSRRKMRILDLP